MARNCGREIFQNVEALKITGFSEGQQASRRHLAVGATIAEADFAPLHARAERAFGAVVGGLDSFVFQESKQPFVMLELTPWRDYGPRGGGCPNAARPGR